MLTSLNFNPGGSAASSGMSGGKIYAFNLINTGGFTQVAPANPSRVQITFHNPGANDIFVFCPAGTLTLTGVRNPIAPNPTSLGGSIRVFGNGGSITLSGECQLAWQAFSSVGNTNPLTVIDSNT